MASRRKTPFAMTRGREPQAEIVQDAHQVRLTPECFFQVIGIRDAADADTKHDAAGRVASSRTVALAVHAVLRSSCSAADLREQQFSRKRLRWIIPALRAGFEQDQLQKSRRPLWTGATELRSAALRRCRVELNSPRGAVLQQASNAALFGNHERWQCSLSPWHALSWFLFPVLRHSIEMRHGMTGATIIVDMQARLRPRK